MARTEMRLQRFLAQCGVASRRECETLISTGRVAVNGQTATLGNVVDPAVDTVALDGKPLRPDDKIYVLLNKPRDVITTAKDTHARKTVMDCLAGLGARVFPVGRLDSDVEGALLLTNDGDLAYRLTHPKFQVDKVYLAWVEGVMMPETALRLELGVDLEDGVAAPEKVVILNAGVDSTHIRLVMREGRKREIKRMCALVGHHVIELQRVAIGNIQIGGLRPGEWRPLTDTEVLGLRKLTGLEI